MSKSSSQAQEKELTPQELYTIAYSLYLNGKYQNALNCFQVLVTMDVNSARYWMGLAASHHMLKNYRGAISSYALAALIDNKNPQIHFHAAECFFALKEGTQALNALATAEQLATNHKDNVQLLTRVTLLRNAWKKQLQESSHE